MNSTMRFARPMLMSIWKNWILHRRHFIITAFEILLPISISFLMVYLSTQMRPHISKDGITQHDATTYKPLEPMKYLQNSYNYFNIIIWYAPNTTGTSKLMKKAFGQTAIEFIGFDSEHTIIQQANKNKERLWGAVIFSNANGSNIPPVLKYKVRPWRKYFLDSGEKYYDGRPESRIWDYISYDHSQFLAIQTSIDLSYIKLREEEGKTVGPDVKLLIHRMPYPPYKSIDHWVSPIYLIPMMICSGFLILCLIIVKRVVDEKNNRAKEMMKMMGMSTSAYWGGIFISNFAVMLIISVIIMGLYTIPFKLGLSVLQDTSFTLFFMVLLLYCASSLLFCCVISTLFRKAAIAITFLTILWIATVIVAYIFVSEMSMVFVGKVFSCLLPNMALTLACNIMSVNEISRNSAQWSNIMEPAFGNPDSFCLGIVLGMMILSCILYTLLLLYLDSVWPWQPGVPKSPLFCFYPSYWFHSKSKIKEEYEFDTPEISEYFEEEPFHSSPSVIISHLSKVFNVENVDKTAVNDLSLNMYPGHITALLGHNGAGKTTTMNILTGIYPPTKGTASINGHDIVTDTDAARSNLGLCPQHNVLYDTLTVEEHLKFFAGLKGMPWSAMNEEITKLIQELELQDKRYTLSKDLSGGMKRKLSLGNAIVGESQILILDEPTTGLDPEARRVIWDVLERLRPGRTILLTTHYMEEADTLGDRIAIMASGTVQCCGSAMFLKRKFGAGYHLRIEKGNNCRTDDITSLVQLHIPEAKLLNDVSLELMYSLSNASERFSALFLDLENSYNKLNIASCGITITTMDDVFLKVGQMTDEQYEMNRTEQPLTGGNYNGGAAFMRHTNISKSPLFQQMKALFKKRVHYAKRHFLLLIFQILLPMIAVILYLYLDFTPTVKRSGGEFNLDLDAMFREKKYGFYQPANNITEMISLANYYKKTLEKESVEVEEVLPEEDPEKYLIEKGIKYFDSYVKGYLIGGSMAEREGNLSVTAWYNGIHYHLDLISINLMTTSLLRYRTKDNKVGIHVTVHPLNPKETDNVIRRDTGMGKIFNTAFLPLGLTFLSSSFVLFPIHERVSKAKLLQRMCGVNGIVYWLMHLSWDFLVHISSSLLLLIPFFVFHGINGFVASDAVGAIFFCLLLYGLSSTTLSYLVSFIPNIPSTGFSILTILNALTGIVITIIMSLLALLLPPTKKVQTALWFMRLFPNFAVTWGINNIHILSQTNIECLSYAKDALFKKCNTSTTSYVCCIDQVRENQGYHSLQYLSWEHGAGKDCLLLFLTFILWSGIVILIETVLPKMCYKIMQNIKFQKRQQITGQIMTLLTTTLNEDSDVSNECQRIEDLFNQNAVKEEALVVNHLTKTFGSVCAVNNLTFGVHKEECFGLLGINGAGKTTTFRMLAGDLLPTKGDACIDYFSIQNNLLKFQTLIGYCPQFDALIDRLTGQEILQLFANLRGIPENEVNHNVEQMISMCDLSVYADKQTRTYSGGTKRKLSLAIALIGAPSIVLLDEPTAGVDPASRRKIWKTLSTMKQMLGVSFILTSHSMDECESLCNRIAIMVNGEFRCLGAMQSLKRKFGQGYSVITKLRQIDSHDINKIAEVKMYMEQCFPSASLKVEYQGSLHYHITDTSMKWSKMFSIMEEAKEKFQLEDYVLSGTTLEQIFLAFARAQKGLV